MTIIAEVSVSGDAELVAKLRQLGGMAPRAIEAGMFVWGEETIGEAKELVPVDTGNLRASGFVMTDSLVAFNGPEAKPTSQALRLRENTSNEVRGVLGFGGPAAPYALVVHENPRSGKTGGVSPSGKKYKTWARVGQWKYLETAVKNHASRLSVRVAESVARMLERLARGAT